MRMSSGAILLVLKEQEILCDTFFSFSKLKCVKIILMYFLKFVRTEYENSGQAREYETEGSGLFLLLS